MEGNALQKINELCTTQAAMQLSRSLGSIYTQPIAILAEALNAVLILVNHSEDDLTFEAEERLQGLVQTISSEHNLNQNQSKTLGALIELLLKAHNDLEAECQENCLLADIQNELQPDDLSATGEPFYQGKQKDVPDMLSPQRKRYVNH